MELDLPPVGVSVNTFKLEFLCNQYTNRDEILSKASFGWGKVAYGFGTDQKSGFHGNFYLPYGYKWENFS